MPKLTTILHVPYGRYRRWLATAAAFALALLLASPVLRADDGASHQGAVKLRATVPIPVAAGNTSGGMYSYDISWVDQATRTYYLADRSNKAVEIVDTKTNTFLLQLTPAPLAPFAGFTPCVSPAGANDCAGPNGVATAGDCLFVTDAPSRVVSFRGIAPVNSVTTVPGEPTRADELAVDPTDHLILSVNNASDPPSAAFVKYDPTSCALTSPTAADVLFLDAAHGVDAKNGAEQPIWDPNTKKFYLSIPQITTDEKVGGVVRIDPKTKMVDNTYLINFCSPAGLTKGPHNSGEVLVGCNTIWDTAGIKWTVTDTNTAAPIQVILNVKTRDQDIITGVGVGDEVWFNKGDGNYYTASSTSPLRPLDVTGAADAQGAAVLGVIDAKSKEVLQLVPTFNVPAKTTAPTHPAGTGHSVAADAENNRVFMPLAANNVYPDCLTGCIAVYGRASDNDSEN